MKKIDNNYDTISIGDIIAFNYSDKTIVHRVIKIIKNNDEYYFYTKGDANKDSDNYVVEMSTIKAIVKYKIPMIGYPIVWLNNI